MPPRTQASNAGLFFTASVTATCHLVPLAQESNLTSRCTISKSYLISHTNTQKLLDVSH